MSSTATLANWKPWLHELPPPGTLIWLRRDGKRLGVFMRQDISPYSSVAGLYWQRWTGATLEAKRSIGSWFEPVDAGVWYTV